MNRIPCLSCHPCHLQVLWALVAIALAYPEEACQLHDETNLLQVSSSITANQGAKSIQELSDAHFLDAGPSDLEKQPAMNHSPPLSWGREVELIDFVYCWAGESQQKDSSSGNLNETSAINHNEGWGFNEMEVSLRSVLLYAPWLNKVYILVNTPATLPKWAAGDARVQMVDRCTLFPQRSDCPTMNTAACESVVHRIPALKEHFVFMEDDFIFVRPVMPLDFFSPDGRPLLTTKVGQDKIEKLYTHRKYAGPDIPPEHVPFRISWFIHRPAPMLLSFSWFLEDTYSEWFAFVRSHKRRFVCCNASIYYGHAGDEDMLTVYPAMLRKHKMGVEIPWTPRSDTRCHCNQNDGPKCILDHIAHHKMVTVQSCTKRNNWEIAKTLLVDNMDSFAQVAERTNFTREHFVSQQCRPVSVPLLSRIYPLQCWPRYESAPLSIPVLASISIPDIILVCLACWVLFAAWNSASSVSAGFLGITTFTQGAILLAYISMSVSHGFLQHHAGSTGYPIVSATLIIYAGKIAVSMFMFLYTSDLRTGLAALMAPGCARFGKLPAWILPMIPGGLLAGYDALSFTSLAHLDPATYQVLLYVRVILVCVMWQVMFKRKLSRTQWLAVLMFIGAGLTKGLDQARLSGSDFHTGLVVVLIQTLMSAVACVLSEILLKEMPMPTDLVNTCMYFWGLVGLVIAMVYQQGYQAVYYNFRSPDAWAKLQGDPWMIASICCLIAFGIVAAYLLKELSNIVKELSRGFVIIICTVLQWSIDGQSAITFLSVLGMAMAVLGICLYTTDPLQNTASKKPHEATPVAGHKLEQHFAKDSMLKPRD